MPPLSGGPGFGSNTGCETIGFGLGAVGWAVGTLVAVIPAKAGIHGRGTVGIYRYHPTPWIPAFAGMTLGQDRRPPVGRGKAALRRAGFVAPAGLARADRSSATVRARCD
jgi:hypothetical protein